MSSKRYSIPQVGFGNTVFLKHFPALIVHKLLAFHRQSTHRSRESSLNSGFNSSPISIEKWQMLPSEKYRYILVAIFAKYAFCNELLGIAGIDDLQVMKPQIYFNELFGYLCLCVSEHIYSLDYSWRLFSVQTRRLTNIYTLNHQESELVRRQNYRKTVKDRRRIK